MKVQSVSQRRVKQLFYTIFVCGIGSEGECFNIPCYDLPSVRQNHRPTLMEKRHFACWVNSDPYSEHEMDIENVILSLSTIADDQSRREQLSDLFAEKLQNQDGGELFMKQFDSAMIVVGDRIRMDATDIATVAAVNRSLNSTSAKDDAEMPSFPLRSQQKSQLEGQLWACIDMMVQSKTLMKQARMK